MIMDERLEFADATSVAAAAGTALIGDVIDLGATPQDLGNGKPMYLVITTSTEIITGGAAGTLKFQLASDAAAAIATDGSATVHIDTGTFVTDGTDANDAQLKAGGIIYMGALPTGGSRAYERYLGILAVTATTTTTAGAINAFLPDDPSLWKSYADGVN
jgi:hypothetical protein